MEKGLVRQQLDSFDEFIQNSMQELVDDSGELRLRRHAQFAPGQTNTSSDNYIMTFNQVYVSKPTATEKDGTMNSMFPHEARLRSLSYASPMYVDIKWDENPNSIVEGGTAEVEIDGDWYECVVDRLDDDSRVADVTTTGRDSREELDVDVSSRLRPALNQRTSHFPKEFLGYVPIMLRSRFCVLDNKTDKELCELGECVYDQGGYFIIKGSEKVVIAQERMSNNHVYCFRKKQPHKYVLARRRASRGL